MSVLINFYCPSEIISITNYYNRILNFIDIFCHDVTKILLKVALNTITLPSDISELGYVSGNHDD
jgi:hypothetical protein